MAAGEIFSGSATISTTEYSLPRNANYNSASPQTTDYVAQFYVDAANMAAGDQFRFRIYEAASASGTQRLVWEATYTGAQPFPLLTFPALILLHGWDITALRLAGSDRAFTWSGRNG